MALLEAEGLTKHFGGVVALNDLSFRVGPGEAVAVVGPNGAGKTTLFNCLLGLEEPDRGTVRFDGQIIDGLPVHARSRLGIGRTFQRLQLFTGMTPREHVLLTARVRSGSGSLWKDLVGLGRTRASERRQADELLELVGLGDSADVPVEALGLGRARIVEIARALVGEPRLLMLDEPSSGLDTDERRDLVALLGRLHKERNTAIVLVEHDLQLVAAAVGRLVVLDFGRVIADGPIDAVFADAKVRQAYLGSLR